MFSFLNFSLNKKNYFAFSTIYTFSFMQQYLAHWQHQLVYRLEPKQDFFFFSLTKKKRDLSCGKDFKFVIKETFE